MSQVARKRWILVMAAVTFVIYAVAFALFYDDAGWADLGWRAAFVLVAAVAAQAVAVWLFGELFRQGVATAGGVISPAESFRAALVGGSVARLLPAGGAVTPVAMAWTVRHKASGTGGAAVRATALNYGGLTFATGVGAFVHSLGEARTELVDGMRIFAGVAVVAGLAVIVVASRLGALRRWLPHWARQRIGSAMVDLPTDRLSHLYLWGRIAAEVMALALVLAAFGLDLGLVEIVTVFGVSQLAAGIPGTPGGLGFAEAGLLGSLAFFGVGAAAAVAPVVVFRIVHYWLPAGAGLVAGTSSFLKSAEATV
ncbi:MAG TPA: flippase-like domain-containing protein [Acidimicrobiia bacterium]|nr:flippase-like domain-containing protein [Acidimicrobiia bacterium]